MRKFTIMAALCCLNALLWGQTPSRASLYDSLDVTYYPTGILHDRSPFFLFAQDSAYQADPYDFSGQPPVPQNRLRQWYQLNRDMKAAALGDSVVLNHDTLSNRVVAARQQSEVPIALNNLFFHRITPGALDSMWLYFDTVSQVYLHQKDTLWLDRANGIYRYNPNPDSLAQLAFERHKLFAGAVATPNVYKEGWQFNITYRLPTSLYVHNDYRQPSLVEIDFDNGAGFQPVGFDNDMQVPYDFSQWDTTNGGSWSPEDYPHPVSETELRIRIHYPGEPFIESRMPINIIPGVPAPDTTIQLSSLSATCSVNIAGHTAKEGRAYTLYGNPDKKIRRPLILIEGFDSGLEDYGMLNWGSMSTGVFYSEGGDRIYNHLGQMPDLFKDLQSAGYDLFVVDFKDGKEHIQNNALSVIKLIQYLNAELAAQGSDEQLVVMGASMGGLIARWALRQIELAGCCHNTRLYATFDSPHRGANIPLGVQHWVKNAADAIGYIVESAEVSYEDVLKSPGASQMSRFHVSANSAAMHQAWIAELDSIGHPEECYKIALINGSDMALDHPITTNNKIMVKSELLLPTPITFVPGTTWLQVLVPPLPAFMQIIHANSYAEANGTIFEYTDFKVNSHTAGLAYAIAGVTYGINVVAKALSYVPVPIPGWSAAWLAVIVATKTVANIILPPLHLVNIINMAIWQSHNAPAGTLNYTEAPGSMTDFPMSVERAGMGLAKAPWPNHTFVASVSGLDIDTTDLYFDIFPNKDVLIRNGEIPFDDYWANGHDKPEPDSRNQFHVQITAKNRAWIIQQLEQNRATRHALRDSSANMPQAKVLQTSYNFGVPAQKYLHGLTIVNNGELNVNKYGSMGFPWGSGGSSSYLSNFNLYTANPACEGVHVTIDNGGEFNVGDYNYVTTTSGVNNNQAQVFFRETSILEIRAGGVLNIRANSSLLIEPGAEIIIHPGAIINLEHETAVLELQGKLTIKQNAVFAPTGSGFVRFNQTGLTAADWPALLNYEANAQMHFTGTGMNDKRVEVAMNTPIYNNLDSLIFNNCRVEMAESVFFGIHSSVSSTSSHFTSIDSLRPATGLRLYGQKYVSINQSRFSYSVEALRGNLLTYRHPLSISNSEFDHNTIGLKFIGKNFNLTNGDLHDNLTGLSAENIDGVSWVKNSDFLDNIAKAIAVAGQHGSILKVSGSNINNSDKGAFTEGTVLQAWCNSWQNNDVAIQAEEGEILMGKPQGHNNSFSGNRLDMYFFELDRLRFVNGYNSLSGWYRYMVGTFSGNATNYLHYNSTTTGYELNVKNNNLPTVGGTMVPVDLSLNQQQVGLHNWGPPSLAITTCQSVGPSLPGITDCCFKTSFTLPISGLGTLPMDSAVLVAASHLDDGDLTTIDYLKEILEYVSDNGYCYPGMEDCNEYTMTDLDVLILRDAYQYYLTALSNAYRNGLIELNRANPEGELSEYLTFIINQTNQRLANEVPNVGATEELEFYYNISKAHAYRMGEHYNEALAILDSHELWSTSREMAQSSYWQCVCDAENALILEELSPDDFAYNLESCRTNLSAKKERYIPNFGGVEVEPNRENRFEALLAPNPSNGTTNLVFAEPTQSGTYAVYTIDGKLVARGTIAKGVTEKELALNLPAGYYTVKVRIGTDEKTLKWIFKY